MNQAVKILAGVLVVLIVVLIAAELALDKVVLKGFNSAAPAALGVPATLDNATLSLVRGRASLEGLHIGNPPGFNTAGLLDLASVSVRLDNASLLTDTIVIKDIAIDGLVVTYEKGLFNSNLGALIESLSDDEKDQEAEEEKGEEKPAKKVIIEKLTIIGSRMNFSITGAMGQSIPLPLPPITLTDLGKEKDGLTVVEAIDRVLRAIAGATGTAIAGSSKLIGDAFGAVGDEAWAVGEGAVGVGTTVVGSTVDAGKEVIGGAVDAGKAVGDALHNLNPFGN
jgi:uncharacterized protein involved in outer membrane biogenesis